MGETSEQNQSLNVQTVDLSTSKSSKNDETQQLSTSTASQSSPTKSTPTKSRSKKKNDARKRSTNLKKQATPAAPTINNETSEIKQKYSQIREPQTLITNKDNQPPRTMEKDSTNETTNESVPSSPPPKGTQELTQSQPQKSIPENGGSNIKGQTDTNSWRGKQHENKEMKEQLKLRETQLQALADQVKQNINKIRELEASLISTTRTCNQFEKLLQQELTNRAKLEAENESLNQTVTRLKNQISVHEKNKTTNDELIRVLNATLMERETEVSILKLKMTRMQTNPSANMPLSAASSLSPNKQDPVKTYAMSGRSNSEFCRNSYIRSSMMAEAASARSSTTQLQTNDRDASIWAKVPEELTPSKRPLVLERNLPPIYMDSHYSTYGSPIVQQSSTPILRDRRYRTLPRSMKSPSQQTPASHSVQQDAHLIRNQECQPGSSMNQPTYCLVTNLDDSNSTSQSDGGNRTSDTLNDSDNKSKLEGIVSKNRSESNQSGGISLVAQTRSDSSPAEDKHLNKISSNLTDTSHYSTISNNNANSQPHVDRVRSSGMIDRPSLPARTPSTPVKISSGLKKIFCKFRRSDSTTDSKSKPDLRIDPPSTPTAGPFQRGSTRSTLVGPPNNIRAQLNPMRKATEFQTDKPFAEWDTDTLVDWLTTIGLSMYASQCRRWVKCGAHIMDATPAEVDKGLGITNHLHRKKLRLAISELNGDCDKITKAASKLDYLWVARWLDDIGLPQHKEAFINARVDGRVLNYLTVEDLVSMGVKSILHHSSIRCGIKVLRSINFDLQLLKRRATADEIEQMSSIRQRMEAEDSPKSLSSRNTETTRSACNATDLSLWTCHRVMEWLRMIDFAEFAPNLRGSGVHGGLIVFEDGFNIETMCSLLSIPVSRTLLRRHLSSFFEGLIGEDLTQRKRQYKELSSNQQLNPLAEIKTSKKSPLWFNKLKSSKVGQDGMDEYLCPMYPVEPQIVKSPTRKPEMGRREGSNLPRIPESINV